jgi:hypothetical protein
MASLAPELPEVNVRLQIIRHFWNCRMSSNCAPSPIAFSGAGITFSTCVAAELLIRA